MDKHSAGDSHSALDADKLEGALLKVEEAVRSFLLEKLPRNVDYKLVLKIEKNDCLTVSVDIELNANNREEITWLKPIVDDAILLARSVFEKYVKNSS